MVADNYGCGGSYDSVCGTDGGLGAHTQRTEPEDLYVAQPEKDQMPQSSKASCGHRGGRWGECSGPAPPREASGRCLQPCDPEALVSFVDHALPHDPLLHCVPGRVPVDGLGDGEEHQRTPGQVLRLHQEERWLMRLVPRSRAPQEGVS